MMKVLPGAAIGAMLVLVSAVSGCASSSGGETTSSSVSSRSCPAQRRALRTMPPVAARDRLPDNSSHAAPVHALSELPLRTTDIARVLDRVRSGLDPSLGLCAAITAHGPSVGYPGPWMTATAHIASKKPPAESYGEWQIELLASASAELFNVSGRRSLDNVLVGVTSRTTAPGGRKPASSDSRLGAITAGQQFRSNSSSDAQIVVDVKQAVEQSGAVPVSVDVWHPLGKAVSVTVRVTDLNAFRRTGWNTLNRSMLESPAEFEGVYLAVEAPDGTSLAAFSSSQRYGAGAQWESPRAGFGYPHG